LEQKTSKKLIDIEIVSDYNTEHLYSKSTRNEIELEIASDDSIVHT
jgi:hypothetical protein